MISVFKNTAGKEQVWRSYDQLLEMWSVDFQEHEVETTFGVTHCITTGSKENPPLLLFHGVGDNSAVMWVFNIQELSKHFYCMAIDTIGGPGKSVPNEHFTKHSFSQNEWVNQIIAHFQLGVVHIAGVSNGASIAYNYAVTSSEKVAKVVCMEGGMVIKPIKAMIRTLFMMFPEILIPTHRNLLRVVKKLSSPNGTVFETFPQVADHLVLLMKNHNQRAMFVHRIEKYEEAKGIAIKDKLYFLVAEHRVVVKEEFIEALNAGGFRYKVIPNTGHGINHEQPEIVNKEVITFLL